MSAGRTLLVADARGCGYDRQLVAHQGGPLLGYNNNVPYKGEVYHVQTEDSGSKRPHVITHLFADGGRVVKTKKTSYAHFIGSENLVDRVRELMREQHKGMVIELRDGDLDQLLRGAATASVSQPPTAGVQNADAPPSAPIELERTPQGDDREFYQEIEGLVPPSADAQPAAPGPPAPAASEPPSAKAEAAHASDAPPRKSKPPPPVVRRRSTPAPVSGRGPGSYSFVGSASAPPKRRSQPVRRSSPPPAEGAQRLRPTNPPPDKGQAQAPPSTDHTGGARGRRRLGRASDIPPPLATAGTDAGEDRAELASDSKIPRPAATGSHRFGHDLISARRFDEVVAEFLRNAQR